MSFTVAYQGVPGAYSEQASKEFAKKHALIFEPVATDSFRELFMKVIYDDCLGMVPIENTTAGSVVECYDLFSEFDVTIIGEFVLPINHCLLAKKGVSKDKIKNVFSHPQALFQCSRYIEKNGFDSFAVKDTAGAAKKLLSNGDDAAALASLIAAEEYGLNILERNVQDVNNNSTRFFLIKKTGSVVAIPLLPFDKSSILFELDSIPAALYKCLGGFATNNVNLLKIESRPTKKKHFDHLFFLDFEGSVDDPAVTLALKELEFFSKMVKVLGSYKKF